MYIVEALFSACTKSEIENARDDSWASSTSFKESPLDKTNYFIPSSFRFKIARDV